MNILAIPLILLPILSGSPSPSPSPEPVASGTSTYVTLSATARPVCASRSGSTITLMVYETGKSRAVTTNQRNISELSARVTNLDTCVYQNNQPVLSGPYSADNPGRGSATPSPAVASPIPSATPTASATIIASIAPTPNRPAPTAAPSTRSRDQGHSARFINPSTPRFIPQPTSGLVESASDIAAPTSLPEAGLSIPPTAQPLASNLTFSPTPLASITSDAPASQLQHQLANARWTWPIAIGVIIILLVLDGLGIIMFRRWYGARRTQ